ncbi:uncharacterized protein LOC144229822 [Crocuta crocuta]
MDNVNSYNICDIYDYQLTKYIKSIDVESNLNILKCENPCWFNKHSLFKSGQFSKCLLSSGPNSKVMVVKDGFEVNTATYLSSTTSYHFPLDFFVSVTLAFLQFPSS